MIQIKKVLNVVLALAVLSLPFIGWWRAQAIEDWIKLRNYTPPPSITSLANRDTMTAQAAHDFYVNHPELLNGVSNFRQDCPESEQAIVLGCYHPNQNGIFVYAVNNPQLNGVEEVTAAHEMLHAAYDRLSSHDKSYVNNLLQSYYKNNLTDQRIKDEINSYKKTEPHDVVNEMHSVFGTEASDLPAPLENYYKRYFADRSAVVSMANNYQAAFTTRTAELDADKVKLDDLKQQINNEEANLKNQLNQINSDRARLDSLASSGQTSAYNASVPGFNSEVDAYNAGVHQLQADISDYNSLVSEYNSLAGELRSLQSSIDTRLTPQPAQ